MVKTVFLDFYGTVVYEDGEIISKVTFALTGVGLPAGQVVHIGDSLGSDVAGASSAGINTIWVNRSGREVPEGVIAVGNLLEAYDTELLK